MKFTLKDENGFPLNYDPSNFYKTLEIMQPLPCSLHNTAPDEYYITTWGRLYIKRLDRYSPKELMKSTNRYVIEQLRDINDNVIGIPMHHLVAETFIFGRPVGDNIVVNHIDGIKWHNEVYNLEWVTRSENVLHADANNLIQRPYGEDNGYAALTDAQYHEICRLTQEGYFPNQINKIMNLDIDITNIAQKIRCGKAALGIIQQYDFSNIPRKYYWRLDPDKAKLIYEYLQNNPNLSYYDIAEALGFTVGDKDFDKVIKAIDNIKNRRTFCNISNQYNF